MKKIIFSMLAALALTACTAPKTLYSWNNYNAHSYQYLKNSDEKSTLALMETYKKIIEEQKGTRGIVPPGVYADYGFLLLQLNETEKGKTMLAKEVELYPEAKVFIERILKMTEK